MSTFNKDKLKVLGFPRSGNTFLNYSLHKMYYPDEEVNLVDHNFLKLYHIDLCIVPIRNPIDSIASSNGFRKNFPNYTPMEYINNYLRFHRFLLNRKDRIRVFEFNNFTKDLQYIKNGVFDIFGITTNIETSIEDIKNSMISEEKIDYLPRNNKLELETLKDEIRSIEKINDCMDAYEKLCEISYKKVDV